MTGVTGIRINLDSRGFSLSVEYSGTGRDGLCAGQGVAKACFETFIASIMYSV